MGKNEGEGEREQLHASCLVELNESVFTTPPSFTVVCLHTADPTGNVHLRLNVSRSCKRYPSFFRMLLIIFTCNNARIVHDKLDFILFYFPSRRKFDGFLF